MSLVYEAAEDVERLVIRSEDRTQSETGAATELLILLDEDDLAPRRIVVEAFNAASTIVARGAVDVTPQPGVIIPATILVRTTLPCDACEVAGPIRCSGERDRVVCADVDGCLVETTLACAGGEGCLDRLCVATADAGVDTGVPTADSGPADAPARDTPPLDAAPEDTSGCATGSTQACSMVGACSGGNETCVDGAWDGVCVGAAYEECGDGADSDCDGDSSETEPCCSAYTSSPGAGPLHTYVFCNRSVGAGTATLLCRALGARGEWGLAEVNSEEENGFLRLQAIDRGFYWIALNDIVTEGDYAWNNGGTSIFRNWQSGQPDDDAVGADEDCVAMDSSTGEWSDFACTGIRPYICESL